MKNFKVQRAETEYNNGNTWEVIDIRFNKVIKTFAKGGDAAAFVRYSEQELEKAEAIWEAWEA